MVFLQAASAVAFALAAQTASSGAPTIDAGTKQAISWARSELHLTGWRLMSASSAMLIFFKAPPVAPGANPRVMLRGEHYPLSPTNPIGSGESFVNVGEVDCSTDRERTLHATVYAASDLQGAIVAGSDETSPWTPIKPDSLLIGAKPELCAATAKPPSTDAPGR